MTCDHYRNIYHYRLVISDGEEVYVESLVGDRMPLYFMKHCLEFLSVVELEPYDGGIRSVGKRFQMLCCHCEEDILDA